LLPELFLINTRTSVNELADSMKAKEFAAYLRDSLLAKKYRKFLSCSFSYNSISCFLLLFFFFRFICSSCRINFSSFLRQLYLHLLLFLGAMIIQTGTLLTLT
jgi:hypothetical protein